MLNNPIICNKDVERDVVINAGSNTRSSSSLIVEIVMEVEHYYNGSYGDGIGWGLSNDSFYRYANSAAFRTFGVRLISFSKNGGVLRANIMIEDVYASSYVNQIANFVNNLCYSAAEEQWTLIVQYEYYVNNTNEDDEYDSGAISVSGGSSSEGYVEFPEEAENDCESISNSEQIKQATKNILDTLYKAEQFSYGKTNFDSFQEFVKLISDNPTKECGASLDLLNGKYGLRELGVFSERQSSSPQYSTCVICLHNHPGGSIASPSPLDLQTFASRGADTECTNYQGELIFSCNENDTTVYFLKVGDRASLENLSINFVGEIDRSTNGFIKGGKCANYLNGHSKDFKNLSSEEALLMQLLLIADEFTDGQGLEICGFCWNNETGRKNGHAKVYSSKKSINKKGKIQNKLIQCE